MKQLSMKNQFLTRKATYLILVLAIMALLLSSCKKDDNIGGNSYMISFKTNGVLEEFPLEDAVSGSFYEDVTKTQFGLRFTGTDNPRKIYLDVYDDKMITESPYTGYAVTPATGQKPAYIVGAKIAYSTDAQTTHSTISQNPDVTISISEITQTTVRGTFSGTLKSNGKADIDITEGKFFVRVVNPSKSV